LTIEVPTALRINAWTGREAPTAALSQSSMRWGLSRQSGGETSQETLLLPDVTDYRDWQHAKVGWGLVLPLTKGLSDAALAGAGDAPEPIQKLVAARNDAPVFRYIAEAQEGYLRRYYTNAPHRDFSLVGSTPGQGANSLPRYLLIYGSPEAIPWSFQYAANLKHYVGRLDLEGVHLERYVNALLSDWKGMTTDTRAPVVWSVDHGHPDITWLMNQTISKQVDGAFASDPNNDLSRHKGLFGSDATIEMLTKALVNQSPSLVVTTSHGMTGPLDDPSRLVAQLGNMVDVDHAVLDSDKLVTDWEPNGAVWYSHACCSAGSDAPSCYAELLDPASDVTAMLVGVAKASGKRVAPLPRKLLGAEKPLRAFIGHVEPTFDWTLRDPETGQPLTHTLKNALYDNLFRGDKRTPVGWAMAEVFQDAAAMLGLWAAALAGVNRNEPKAREWALYRQLTALDRQHTVILGDPTVALPAIT
jgi:hypothetical protein